MSNDNSGAIPSIDSEDDIDRGELNITGRKKSKKMIIVVFLLIGVVIIILSIVSVAFKKKVVDESALPTATNESLLTTKTKDIGLAGRLEEITKQDEEAKLAVENIKKIEKENEDIEKLQKEKLAHSDSLTPVPSTTTSSSSTVGTSETKNDAPVKPVDRKRLGSVLVNLGSTGGSTTAVPGTSASEGSMGKMLKGESYLNGVAMARQNLDFLLIHGTSIPCVLKTKIVTTYKGLVLCQVTKDVYSANGNVLLVDRGATVFGEQKVALTQGQARVFLNWTDVETSKGVRITINSLGTDALGATGANAWVDNHFAERFGGAIMLSFIDDVFASAAKKSNSSDGGMTFDNSSKNGTDMASKALDNSINIPPTAYINQGELLNILVARDIDMRSVYRIQ